MKTSTLLRSVLGITIVLFAGSQLATTAQAGQIDALPSKTVKFADLNLARPEGIAALYERLQGAADEVCSPGDPRVLVAFENPQKCARASLWHAIGQINDPALTAYAQARSGRASPPLVAER